MVAERSDLSAVLTFVTVIGVNNEIIQGIVHSIPGKRSGLAQRFRRDLRQHRWTDASATFFITKSLHPKKPILDPEARVLVVSAFRFAVENNRIYLRAFVVMPDHWHGLFALRDPWTLPKFMHDFMS